MSGHTMEASENVTAGNDSTLIERMRYVAWGESRKYMLDVGAPDSIVGFPPDRDGALGRAVQARVLVRLGRVGVFVRLAVGGEQVHPPREPPPRRASRRGRRS